MEADEYHKLLLQEKDKFKPIQGEISQILSKIKMLREEVQRRETEEKKKVEENLREKLERQVREKLKRGEKLTWEEFQLLAEKEIGA